MLHDGTYVPNPPQRPLLLRPLRWAGGLTPLALLFVVAIGFPFVLGAIFVIVEIDGFEQSDR